MSDQTPAEQDTSEVAGPDGTGAAEQQAAIDWQERYSSLQPEYTRATQEAAQLRERNELYELMVTGDPDTRRQAAEALGYQIDEDEPDTQQYEDPVEQLRAELRAEFRSELSQRDQQAQEAQIATQTRAVVDERLGQLDFLSKKDQDIVLAYAINALPAVEGPNGLPMPDIDQAYKVLQDRDLEAQKNWAKSKRAPRISPVGQSATEAPDLSTHEGRVAHMTQLAADRELDQ